MIRAPGLHELPFHVIIVVCYDRINALYEAANFTLVMSTPILVAIAGFGVFALTARPRGLRMPCMTDDTLTVVILEQSHSSIRMPTL